MNEEKTQLPAGWVAVPRIGTRVRADHPQTCINPEPTFVVTEVRAERDGGGFAVRGENTCWFGIGMIASPSVNEEKTEAAGGVGSSQPERFTDQAKPRQCWAVEMGWERKACETPCAMKKCNPAGVMASDDAQPKGGA